MGNNIIITTIILLFSNLSLGQLKGDIIDKQINEKMSFSDFAKVYVDEKLIKWQKKDEFEKTADWELRVTEDSKKQKIETFYEEAIDAYAEKLKVKLGFCYIGASLSLGNYDADKEVYTIKSRDFGDLEVPVPFDEAEKFKNKNWCGYDSDPTNVFYYITNDQLGLAQATFWDKYTYVNPLAKNRKKTKKEVAIESLSSAIKHYKKKEYEQAVSFYQLVREINPNLMYNNDLRDFSMASFQIKNYSNVLECFDAIINKSDYLLGGYGIENNLYILLTACFELKEYSKGIEINSKYFNGKHNVQISNLVAQCYNGLGKYEKALEKLNQANQIDNNFSLTYLNLGNTYNLMGNKKEAIKNYKIAAKLGNQDARLILKEF